LACAVAASKGASPLLPDQEPGDHSGIMQLRETKPCYFYLSIDKQWGIGFNVS
jgi:hypothetical protein